VRAACGGGERNGDPPGDTAVSNNVATALIGSVGFMAIACATWFFSRRPRLFIRVFVSREDWRGVIQSILRDPNYGRGMRWIAALQFAVAIIIMVATLAVWALG
jgi:hypothetical protein